MNGPARSLTDYRIIILDKAIDNDVSSYIIQQLLLLNEESKIDEIRLFINSPGGSVTAGMAIHDVMRRIDAPVHTICCGIAASMASIILAAGDRRFIYENSEVMIHQPLGGYEGQAVEIEIYTKRIKNTRNKLEKLLSKYTGQSLRKIHKDCDRDRYFSSEEALKYGLVDEILKV